MADTTGGADNNRVTLAIVQNDIRYMKATMDRRFDALEHKVDILCESKDELAERVTRNEERLKQTTGFLALFSVIGNAIAAGIGTALK